MSQVFSKQEYFLVILQTQSRDILPNYRKTFARMFYIQQFLAQLLSADTTDDVGTMLQTVRLQLS